MQKLGKYCSISWNVSIGGANHDYHKVSTQPFCFKPKFGFTEIEGEYSSFEDSLTIGNDVWIGSGSTILRGVTVGDGAVIGASSVVTEDVPAYSIVVGNPGKIIKYRFSMDIIWVLKSISWWNWAPSFIRDNISFFREGVVSVSSLNELKQRYNLYVKMERKQG